MVDRRHKQLLGTVLAVILAGVILAGSPALADNSDRHFIWKVQGNPGTVYLMGSIHFVRPDFYPLDKVFEDAFAESDYLAVEADVDQIDRGKLNQLIAGKGMYPEGDSLENHVSAETMARLKDMNIDIGLVKRIRPWLLAIQLQVQKLVSLGFDPNQGMDMHFLKLARDRKKIVELEGLDRQLEVLYSLGPEDQDLFLRSTLAELNNMEAQMNQFVAAWKAGDTARFDRLFFQEAENHPEFATIIEKVLFERNKNMLDKIEQYLQNPGTGFVIVGAGHLVGPKGIVSRLKEKNFKVEQK